MMNSFSFVSSVRSHPRPVLVALMEPFAVVPVGQVASLMGLVALESDFLFFYALT